MNPTSVGLTAVVVLASIVGCGGGGGAAADASADVGSQDAASLLDAPAHSDGTLAPDGNVTPDAAEIPEASLDEVYAADGNCAGLSDGSPCGPGGVGFDPSVAAGLCADGVCHPTEDFVLQCWGFTTTCNAGMLLASFSYEVQLPGTSSSACPDGQTCTSIALAELASVGDGLLQYVTTNPVCDSTEEVGPLTASTMPQKGTFACGDCSDGGS